MQTPEYNFEELQSLFLKHNNEHKEKQKKSFIQYTKNQFDSSEKNRYVNEYTIKHFDHNLLTFSLLQKDVYFAAIGKSHVEELPLPLKRIIHNQEEFIQEETDNFFVLNEEGCWLIEMWLNDREIPVNRDNYSSYIKKGSSSRQWMLENNAYSFTDCYWIDSGANPIKWKDIKEKMSKVDEFYTVKEQNRMYKGHNSTLGGELEKFWYKSDGTLKLCKKVSKLHDILNAREVIASLIYQKQGYAPYCHYDFVYDSEEEIVGVKCKAFTSENVELISSYDLLEEHNRTQQPDVYELIIEYAAEYGLDKQIATKYMDIQTIVDYLITNRDRHQGNIGFLRDSGTLQIIGPAPIFDSGSSKHMEAVYPEDVENTIVNGLYNTEMECLSHVKDLHVIDINKLPSKEEILSILNECQYISEKRKEKFLTLYESKIEYLQKLQKKELDISLSIKE